MKKILFILLSIVIFTAVGCTTNTGSDSPSVTPKKGKEITLKDCMADPYVLQVKDGIEVTFKNPDNVSHTIFIDNQEFTIEAQSEIGYVAKATLPVPFTTNYLCDNQSLPKGGAIYIE